MSPTPTSPEASSPVHRDPVALMRREMQPRAGNAGTRLAGHAVAPGKWMIVGEEFLLRLPGLAFRYSKREGLIVERGAGADPVEEALYLSGTVYAAVACINGLYPIHASAVACDGGVHAFTGPSGAGKSTLVAALGRLGLPMFCDDTLILDLSDPETVMALPGHKRLKLTPEAIGLVGLEPQERVHDEVEKFYAEPPGGDWREPLPLRRLVFLEEGADPAVQPVSGAEKIARLSDDHYTTELHRLASGLEARQRFALQARLARAIAMARLVRPIDTARFTESVALARALVLAQETGA